MVVALKTGDTKHNYFLVKRKVAGVSRNRRFYFEKVNHHARERALARAEEKDLEWASENTKLRELEKEKNFNFKRKMIKDGGLRGFTMTLLHRRFITLSYTIHVKRVRYHSNVNLGKKYSFEEGFELLLQRYLSLFDPEKVNSEEAQRQISITKGLMRKKFEELAKKIVVNPIK